jgi:hypothetical protein
VSRRAAAGKAPLPRALLLVAALAAASIAGAAAWLWVAEPYLRQRAAVTALRELGARFRVVPCRFDRIRKLLGAEGTDRVIECWLNKTEAEDRHMDHIAALRSISVLSIERTGVGDGGLEHIRGLTRLRTLYCGYSKVTGAGLQSLAPLSRLEYLSLEGLPVADEHLAALAGLGRLRCLGLDRTKVTDGGLEVLRDLPLEVLWLDHTRVEGPGLAAFAGHEKLSVLSLGNTPVSDEVVPHLEAIAGLTRLRLTGTHLSGASLEGLVRLPRLEVACLTGTRIDHSALMEMEKARPGLDLRCDDVPPPSRPRPLDEAWVEEREDPAKTAR